MNKLKTIYFPLIILIFSLSIIAVSNSNIMMGLWSQGAVISTPSYSGVGIAYQRNDTGWIYCIGGYLDQTGTVTNRTARYNVNTDTWTNLSSLQTTIVYSAGVCLKDSLYVVAGMTNSYFSSESAILYKFDVNSNTWSTRTSLPQALGGNEAVSYQDSLIYNIGGMNAGGSNAVNNVYLYNSKTNLWRWATPLPSALCLGACSISGDTLIYGGGSSSYFSGYVNTVYLGVISQSDRSQITWSVGTVLPGGAPFRGSATSWGKKGIILLKPNTSLTQCYTYSPGNNTWIQQPDVPIYTSSPLIGSIIYSNNIAKFVVASGSGQNNIAINNTQIYTDNLVGITNKQNKIPVEFSLSQNYPNPFNPNTIIKYQIPVSSKIEIIVYDVLGRAVSVLANEYKQAGSYSVEFNAENIPSGIYFYKISAGKYTDCKKMILLK